MKKTAQQSVTSLPPSPDEERRGRMIKYSIAMSVRVLCVILCFFAHGWWLLVFALLAVILPYFAVVVANTAVRSTGVVLRPGSIVRSRDAGAGESE